MDDDDDLEFEQVERVARPPKRQQRPCRLGSSAAWYA